MKRFKSFLCTLCLIVAFSAITPAPIARAGDIEMGVVVNPPPPPPSEPPAQQFSAAPAAEDELTTLNFFTLLFLSILSGLQGALRP